MTLQNPLQEDANIQLQKYIALFTDPNSVMVSDKPHSVVAGCAKLKGWRHSTGMQSGSGRMCNRKLFGVPDRMLWETGVTCFDRTCAQELEDWGIEAIAVAFPNSPCGQERQLYVEAVHRP